MPQYSLSLYLLLALALANHSAAQATPYSPDKAIVGQTNWYPATKAQGLLADRAKSVGRLTVPSTLKNCQATLITTNLVLTNAHCVASAKEAQGVWVSFEYDENKPLNERKSFDCSQFLKANSTLDLALLQCKNNPGKSIPLMPVDEREHLGLGISVIHHNCDYYSDPNCQEIKLISPGKWRSPPVGLWAVHNADTLNESSAGAIVDNQDYLLVGLHKGSLLSNDHEKALANMAIKGSSIVKFLLSYDPQMPLTGHYKGQWWSN